MIKITEEKKEKGKRVFDPTKWKDISHEKYRVYVFSHNMDQLNYVKIDKPTFLHVSESGGHRILDSEDVSHYIPYKWIHLFWETDDDCAFRF